MFWVGKFSLTRVISVLVLLAICLLPVSKPTEASPALDSDDYCALYHIVKRGETLGMIASRYGTSVDQILEDNNLDEGDRIRPGDLLCISDPGFEWEYPNAEMFANVSLKTYTVQVVGGGFPVRYRFLVKVRVNRAGPWRRVGALRTTRYGDFDVTFNLPRNVKYVHRLDVCLKDIVQGYLVCDRLHHIKPVY